MTTWGPGTLYSEHGYVTTYTPTEFVIGVSSGTYHAFGTGLTYYVDSGAGTITFIGGTVTSVNISAFSGNQDYTISGFSMPVDAFFAAFSGSTDQFLAAFLGGDDTINGTASSDVLFGYTGNDSIYGGEGDDTLIADLGDDLMDGGTGTNTVSYRNATGGVTVDLTQSGPQDRGGGMGTDTLVSIQNIEGSNYDDVLTVGSGSHVLNGLDGNDTLWAESGGDDTVNGGNGNDVFHMQGPGNKTATGGNGDDTFYLQNATTVTADGGTGNDTFYLQGTGTVHVLDAGSAAFYLGASLDASDTVFSNPNLNSTLYLDGDYSSHLMANVAVRTTVLAGGHDYNLDYGSYFPSTGILTLDASALGPGDHLTLSGRFSTVTGGAGNDLITTPNSLGTAFHLEEGGNDTVTGSVSNDIFYFGPSLTSADVIDGGPDGYADSISLNGDYSSGIVLNAKHIYGINLAGGHSYKLTLGPQYSGTNYSTSPTNPFLEVSLDGSALGPGDALYFDASVLQGYYFVGATGGAGNDTLISAQGTSSHMAGGAGNDLLIGTGFLYGQDGNDTLQGGNGTVNLDGGNGNDLLIGGAAANTLTGGPGDDVIIPHGTSDAMTGGAGSDTFVISSLFDPTSGNPINLSIGDLDAGDQIDLTGVSGLTFIGATGFTGAAGQMNYVKDYQGTTTLQFDRDGDGNPDAYIRLGSNLDIGETAPGSKILHRVPDATAPLLIAVLPPQGDTFVSVHGGIFLTFNEAVKAGSGTIDFHTLDGTVATTLSVNDATRFGYSTPSSISLYPAGLSPGTAYYVTIPSGAITDVAGNPFAGISSPDIVTFTTAPQTDTVAPYVTAWSFGSNQRVPVDKNFEITFSEPIAPGHGSAIIVGGQSLPLSDPTHVRIDGNKLIINLPTDLAYASAYAFYFSGVVDYAGNPLFSYYQYFSTVGAPRSTPPTIVSITPANNSGNVSVYSHTILIKFDELVRPGSGYVDLHTADGTVVYHSDVAQSSDLGFAADSVAWFPSIQLAAGTNYYLTIDSGAILDDSGNAFAGMSGATAYHFTTAGAADITAPTLSVSYPADNATNIPPNAVLTLGFSEAVTRGTGYIYIYRDDGSLLEQISVNDPLRTFFQQGVPHLHLSPQLAPGTSYYVLIDPGTFLDMAGHPFAGISSPMALNFTTAAPSEAVPPTLVTSTFWQNPTNASLNAVQLTFSEPVIEGSGSFEIRKSSDGSLFESLPVTDPSRVDVITGNSSYYYILTPSQNLDPSTQYYIVFPDGIVQDLSGNPIQGVSSTTTLAFTTGLAVPLSDNTPPHLTATAPADHAAGVALDANIVLTFDESVEAGAGVIDVWRADGTLFQEINVADATQVTFSGNLVTINPSTDFSANTAYYVTIESGVIQDFSANVFSGIANVSTLSFTTGKHLPGGDFDANLKSDILWQNDNGQADVWLMNGITVLSGNAIGGNPGTAWHVKGTGDFDGAGKADVLWRCRMACRNELRLIRAKAADPGLGQRPFLATPLAHRGRRFRGKGPYPLDLVTA
jgi:Ca2+-binding RTX toxin-like protein/methionine-rich copper-binding protein CopC